MFDPYLLLKIVPPDVGILDFLGWGVASYIVQQIILFSNQAAEPVQDCDSLAEVIGNLHVCGCYVYLL